MPGIQLAGAGQNQINPPEIVSYEIQGKVSVHTKIFVRDFNF